MSDRRKHLGVRQVKSGGTNLHTWNQHHHLAERVPQLNWGGGEGTTGKFALPMRNEPASAENPNE